MNEADLELLLTRAATRLRLDRALRAALLAVGLSLLLAALIVLIMRRQAAADQLLLLPLLAPVVIALTMFVAALLSHRPASEQVAFILDQRAATGEQLVTWQSLRSVPDSQLNALQCGFRLAQQRATLEQASRLNVGALVPVRLPEWTRLLLMALLLLCCALLVPAAQSESAAAPSSARSRLMRGQPRVEFNVLAEPGATEPQVTVQPFSPQETKQIVLLMTDPRLSAQEKLEQLKRAAPKLADIPLSELPPLLRDVIRDVEKEAAQTKTPNNSSATTAGKSEEPAPIQLQTPADISAFKEKARAALRQRYQDVEAQLQRYYAPETTEEKTGGTR